ncbi:MAG: nitrile hydratase accessory protein [Pseudomonadota bacterium]
MKPTPVFIAPWHAQVFALTVHLNEAGHFAWAEWGSAFGATLKRHGLARALNGGDDYFVAWLETLEALLSDLDIASAAEVGALRDLWATAYLATPHGQQVRLRDG